MSPLLATALVVLAIEHPGKVCAEMPRTGSSAASRLIEYAKRRGDYMQRLVRQSKDHVSPDRTVVPASRANQKTFRESLRTDPLSALVLSQTA